MILLCLGCCVEVEKLLLLSRLFGDFHVKDFTEIEGICCCFGYFVVVLNILLLF